MIIISKHIYEIKKRSRFTTADSVPCGRIGEVQGGIGNVHVDVLERGTPEERECLLDQAGYLRKKITD